MVSRADVLQVLSRTKPTPCRKVGDKLKLPQTRKGGQITKERSHLIDLLDAMCSEGRVDWIEHEGLIRTDKEA